MWRFRPNLVVSGAPPHAEDEWSALHAGGVEFRVARPCERCSVICVDPAKGEREQEPLRTLATYRKRDGKVLFGVNLVHRSEGVVRVGDAVTAGPAP
jgi:hypothetical protein